MTVIPVLEWPSSSRAAPHEEYIILKGLNPLLFCLPGGSMGMCCYTAFHVKVSLHPFGNTGTYHPEMTTISTGFTVKGQRNDKCFEKQVDSLKSPGRTSLCREDFCIH